MKAEKRFRGESQCSDCGEYGHTRRRHAARPVTLRSCLIEIRKGLELLGARPVVIHALRCATVLIPAHCLDAVIELPTEDPDRSCEQCGLHEDRGDGRCERHGRLV